MRYLLLAQRSACVSFADHLVIIFTDVVLLIIVMVGDKMSN